VRESTIRPWRRFSRLGANLDRLDRIETDYGYGHTENEVAQNYRKSWEGYALI
jgi:hypothetical protein